MAKHILVPLDGSERAERALPVGISLAARTGATLVFVCASAQAELTDPEGYLEAAAFAWDVPEAEWFVVRDRPAGPAVQQAAADYADPLICMTTRGRGPVASAVLGSVTNSVIRDVACPIVIVGPELYERPWVPGPIVAGLDGVTPARRMLNALAPLAQTLDVPLWLLHVAQPGATEREDPSEAADLEREARSLRNEGVEVAWEVLHATDPADALIEFARSRHAGLLAAATHARAGVGGLVLGSVARQLVQDAPVPVFVARAGD